MSDHVRSCPILTSPPESVKPRGVRFRTVTGARKGRPGFRRHIVRHHTHPERTPQFRKTAKGARARLAPTVPIGQDQTRAPRSRQRAWLSLIRTVSCPVAAPGWTSTAKAAITGVALPGACRSYRGSSSTKPGRRSPTEYPRPGALDPRRLLLRDVQQAGQGEDREARPDAQRGVVADDGEDEAPRLPRGRERRHAPTGPPRDPAVGQAVLRRRVLVEAGGDQRFRHAHPARRVPVAGVRVAQRRQRGQQQLHRDRPQRPAISVEVDHRRGFRSRRNASARAHRSAIAPSGRISRTSPGKGFGAVMDPRIGPPKRPATSCL